MKAKQCLKSLALAAALLSSACAHVDAQTLPLDGFKDAINHWQAKNGQDYPRYAPENVSAIADNLLLLQRDHGGWIQNHDPVQIFSEDARNDLTREKSKPDASFDNRNIYTQSEYLAGAYELTGKTHYLDGARRGLDFLISQQLPTCAGWPHTVPAKEDYQARLTIADEVFSGSLRFLQRVAEGEGAMAAFDAADRSNAREALEKGEACLLKLQIKHNGALAGWAGQYDPDTLAPAKGRAFELPAMASQETVEIVRYLMSIKAPSAEVRASIEGAVSWLKASAIEGVRYETVSIEPAQRVAGQGGDSDRVLTPDDSAPLVWARFYDVEDNSIVLANRDGLRVARFEDVHPERRAGYSWYGYWPQKLIEKDYPKWKTRTEHVGTPN